MKLSIREKVAYGLGDTASNFIFATIMSFQALFYTDVFGLEPYVMGIMFIAVRVIDAITDPLMGTLADRTKTKYGSFRPYLLWLALPFGILSMMAFTTPDMTEINKIIYAFVTYTLLMFVYTAINIPYCALGGVITPDESERVSVQSYRFVFAFIGGLVVSSATLPLVDYFGQGDAAKGWQYAMAVMGGVGILLFLLSFLGTKERVSAPPQQQYQLKRDIKTLAKNDQWVILSMATLILLAGNVLKMSFASYYVKDFLNIDTINIFGWSIGAITCFVTATTIGSMFGAGLAQFVASKVNKIKAYIYLQVGAALISAVSYFVMPENVYVALSLFAIWGFLFNMATPLLWSKMADVVDYGQYLSGQRLTGLVYSSILFFLKLGIAIGGGLVGFMLSFYGYQAGIEQSPDTAAGIALCFTLLPAVFSILVAIIMRNYILTPEKVNEIQKSLPAIDINNQQAVC